MAVTVTIEDVAHHSRVAKLAEYASVGRLIPAIVAQLGLPITDPGGRPVLYRLHYKNRQLEDTETVQSAGIKEGDTIVIASEITAGGEREIADFIESLKAIIQQQAGTKNPIVQVTAPVELPTPDQMKVKLVPSHMLSQLEETRSDENHWSSVGWAFLGAILGVIVNWVTTEQNVITRSSLVLIAVFIISGLLAFAAARRFAARARMIRAEMIKAGGLPTDLRTKS